MPASLPACLPTCVSMSPVAAVSHLEQLFVSLRISPALIARQEGGAFVGNSNSHEALEGTLV